MPDILTPEQVAECRERAERATKGPWEVEGGGGMHMDGTRDWYTVSCPWNVHTSYHIGLGVLKLPEAEFVAHARVDIPALCATVEALQAENERLRAVVEAARPVIEWAREHWKYGLLVEEDQARCGEAYRAHAALAALEAREAGVKLEGDYA